MNQKSNIKKDDFFSIIRSELSVFEKEFANEFQSSWSLLQSVIDQSKQESGKRLRPVFYFLSQGLIKKTDIKTVRVAVLLELLHNATLYHDDVVDESQTRRGAKTLNALVGNKVSVLFGDYLFARVLALGVESEKLEVLNIVSRIVMDMGRVELSQILRNKYEIDSEENYFDTIHGKTAGLFAAAGQLAGVTCLAHEEINQKLFRIGQAFGTAFQIRDDILDLTGSSLQTGKPSGQDILNGNYTLPLIYANAAASESQKNQLNEHLQSTNSDSLNWLNDFIVAHDGIQQAQLKAESESQEALELIAGFNPSKYRDALEEMIHFNLTRTG